ncbi:Arc family DNA-binding protein [Psychrobacter sp. I-STPA6b]|nr:Arc family DNA-binding protein [Psychrobacter sp. I-STPA6b]
MRGKQVNVRIEESLYEWLKKKAEKERRSMTSQLNIILEKEKANATA